MTADGDEARAERHRANDAFSGDEARAERHRANDAFFYAPEHILRHGNASAPP